MTKMRTAAGTLSFRRNE